MEKIFKKTMAFILTLAMAVTGVLSIPHTQTAEAAEDTGAAYSAFTSFQINNVWAARDICVSPNQGLNGGMDYTLKNVGETGNNVTYNYLKQYFVSNGLVKKDKRVVDAGFKDVTTIDKNGTYTLEITDFDTSWLPLINAKAGDKFTDTYGMEQEVTNDTMWNMLCISTDIPTLMKGVTCTDVKVYLDDESTPFAELAEAPHNEKEGSAAYSGNNGGVYAFYIFDTYADSRGTKGVLDNTQAKYKRFPTKSLKIEFTISGIGSVNPDPIPQASKDTNFTATLTSNGAIWDSTTPSEVAGAVKVKAGEEVEATFTVSATDAATNVNAPSFTATLTSYGSIWGWNETPDSSTESENTWTVDVTDPGDYTVKGIATQDASFDMGGALAVVTDLTALPKGYTISGKTIKIAGNVYDWSGAKVYKDGEYIRISIWNSWGDEEANQWAKPTWKVTTSGLGDYTVKGTATQDASSHSGALYVNTSLKRLPVNCTIVGKTIKVADREYDWSGAKAYRSDGRDRVRISIWNEWIENENANPLGQDIEIKAGEKVEVNFSLIDEPNPNPDFTAILSSSSAIWKDTTPAEDLRTVEVKTGDEVEATFTVKAIDGAIESKFRSFTAHLASFGTIWGWTEDDYGAPNGAMTEDTWKVDVTGPGEYTVKGIATQDTSTDSCSLQVMTDLTTMPEGYTISGKTVKVTDREYDWSGAEVYANGDYLSIFIWNEWGDENTNPITSQYPKNAAWTASPNKLGDYTVTGTATQDASSGKGALYIDTDLTELPKGYTISGKTVKVAGKEYDWSKAEAYMNWGKVYIFIWNKFFGNEKTNPIDQDIEIKAGDEVEVTFTVKSKTASGDTGTDTDTGNDKNTDTDTGNDKDNNTDTGTGNDKDNSTNTDADADKDSGTKKEPVSLAKNQTFTSGNFKYKVTAAAKNKTSGKVSVVGLSASGKKKSSISVKNTVSVSGVTYKIATITSKAFKDASKLTNASLGTNITSIPISTFDNCRKLSAVTATGVTNIDKSAFKNCAALKTLTLKNNISVKKGAFKGCKKTIKVTGASKKINKANVKKLKKSGYKKFK